VFTVPKVTVEPDCWKKSTPVLRISPTNRGSEVDLFFKLALFVLHMGCWF
jgi:hypothetical protein